MISISYFNKTFTLKAEHRSGYLKAKQCGFVFDPFKKEYITKNKRNAFRLREYFDVSAKNLFKSTSLKISQPWSGRIPLPENKKLEQVQIDSVKFAMERNHSFLALEQRLGKTPTAIATINTIDNEEFQTSSTLIIVPPFLVSNWVNEIKSWQHREYKIQTIIMEKQIFNSDQDIYIVSDSIISKPDVLCFLNKQSFDLLILDEAHRMNVETSKRTEVFYKNIKPLAKKIVMLSGTPMRNRPIDLWPVLSNLAHNIINYASYESYAKHFCGAYTDYVNTPVGTKSRFVVNGSSNEDELSKRLQHFMKVEKFKDHFDVKEKEEIVILKGNTKKITELSKTILQNKTLEELVGSVGLGEIASLRRMISEEKFPIAKEYIENALNSTDDKFLIFGFHIDLLEKLYKHFKPAGAFLINGKTPMKERTVIQKEFNSGDLRIGFANIFTMQGIDLSAANRNIFVESSWGPSDNNQAKFRAFGRNQKRNVYTEHLVIGDTIDEYVMRKVLEKKKMINNIIRKGIKYESRSN